MALDTRSNRLSILDFYAPSSVGLPDPDGSFNAADRQQIVGGYRDIEWAIPSPGIGKGNVITASDIVEYNTSFDHRVLHARETYSAGPGGGETTLSGTVYFWIRNGVTPITSNLRVSSDISDTIITGGTNVAKIYDSEDTLLYTFTHEVATGIGGNPTKNSNYTLDSGYYKIVYTVTPQSQGFGKSRATLTIDSYPYDTDIITNDVVRVYLEDLSGLDPTPQKITVAVAESGLMTSNRGTDEEHGGT